MNEKLIKTLTIVVTCFVVLLIIIFGISSCSNKKNSYTEYEDEMLKIAKKHFKNNEKNLPKINNKKTISLESMVETGKIKDAADYLNIKDAYCKGNVTVYNNNGYYLYTPYLNCGKEYKTALLKDKIIENSLTEKGVGLYQVGNKYIMKGEVKNNYLKFNDMTFRIIRINEDGSIRVIQSDSFNNKYWDNRYNPDVKSNNGINEYIHNNLNSRAKDTIEEYYKNEEIWSKEDKAYIQNQDLCIGKRLKNDTSKDGSIECSKKLPNQQFSMLAAYEYLQASLDTNCISTKSTACSNYNWFTSFDSSIWTITADAEDSDNVWKLKRILNSTSANTSSGFNIVINIVGDITYSDGDGTELEPYIVK